MKRKCLIVLALVGVLSAAPADAQPDNAPAPAEPAPAAAEPAPAPDTAPADKPAEGKPEASEEAPAKPAESVEPTADGEKPAEEAERPEEASQLDAGKSAYEAAAAGDYGLAVLWGLIFIIGLLRLGAEKGPDWGWLNFFSGKLGGYILAFGAAAAGTMILELQIAGGKFGWQVVSEGIIFGFAAIGGWQTIKDYKNRKRVGRKREPLAVRFMRKVQKSPRCWIWTGALVRGYGQISAGTGKGNIRAHRASWLIHKGPIPEGMHVLHRCDNTKCVNPSHLFLGTAEDNAKDREAKGRGNNPGQPPGEKHARARLTAAQVIDIRKRCAAGEKTKDIAARFGVTEGTIADIRNRRRWKHLP